jgi:hypothetical protein
MARKPTTQDLLAAFPADRPSLVAPVLSTVLAMMQLGIAITFGPRQPAIGAHAWYSLTAMVMTAIALTYWISYLRRYASYQAGIAVRAMLGTTPGR